jgi:hypothetical protein
MKRIWSIEEQSFNDEASGFGFEFSSAPDQGDGTDGEVRLRIANEGRTKVLEIVFDRNGMKTGSTVEGGLDLSEKGADEPLGRDGQPTADFTDVAEPAKV